LKAVWTGAAHDPPVARQQLTVLDATFEDTNMEPRRKGLIWQVLGFLVVIAAVLRSAAQQFTWILNQKFAGSMDLVWPYAVGVYAGFLLLAGAAAMISSGRSETASLVPQRNLGESCL
jgi:hypothetical protein